MINKILLVFLLSIIPIVSMAEIAGFNEKGSLKIIASSMNTFWDKAEVMDGDKLVPIKPPKDTDPSVPPVSHEDAIRVLNKSYLVGNAMWCDLEWQNYFLKFMVEERQKSYSQIQIAYIGYLFGLGQSSLNQSLRASNKVCPDISKKEIAKRLLVFSGVVEVNDFRKFRHSSGIFEIDIPSEWKETNSVGGDMIVTFAPDNSELEFTISLTPDLNLPKELPSSFMNDFFPNEKPISDIEPSKGNGWNSIEQNFSGVKSNKPTIWFAKIYGFQTNAVFITLSDSESDTFKHSKTYEQILNSIEFRDSFYVDKRKLIDR